MQNFDMKKIEEKLEHEVKAYVCYVSSFYARNKNTVCVCSHVYDEDKCVNEFFGYYTKCNQVSVVLKHLLYVQKKCNGLNFGTIRVMNPYVKDNSTSVEEKCSNEIYLQEIKDFIVKTKGFNVEVEVVSFRNANKIDNMVNALARKSEDKIPSMKEFDDYCKYKKWSNPSLNVSLYKMLYEKGLKAIEGCVIGDWHVWAEEYYLKLCEDYNAKCGKVEHERKRDKKGKVIPDYICYTDGSCDNMSYHKAGGAAYIVVNTATGEIEKVKTHHCLHTTNNRMEMLAILSAVNACPKGSTIEIRTDSQYSIKMFANTKWVIREGVKNPDLIRKYRDCAKGKKVILTWVKGHNGDNMNEQADCLAFGAYEQALMENGLPLAPERFRKMRRARQTIFETA